MDWQEKGTNVQRHGEDGLKRRFARIKKRQLIAIAFALVCVFSPALIWKRPELFGLFPKKALVLFQFFVILLFINFTSWNWKCPACRRYLGNDIGSGKCRKCGARLG